MGAELFVPPRRDDADESIGEFMARRFGTEAKEYLAEPLLAGIHAGDVDRLSMRALFPRLVAAERESGSLLRAFRAWPRSAEEGGPFRSLPEGLSEMVRALVATLPRDAIRLNCPVTDVQGVEAGRVDPTAPTRPTYVVTTGAGDRLTAHAVIVAVPAPVAGVEPASAVTNGTPTPSQRDGGVASRRWRPPASGATGITSPPPPGEPPVAVTTRSHDRSTRRTAS